MADEAASVDDLKKIIAEQKKEIAELREYKKMVVQQKIRDLLAAHKAKLAVGEPPITVTLID